MVRGEGDTAKDQSKSHVTTVSPNERHFQHNHFSVSGVVAGGCRFSHGCIAFEARAHCQEHSPCLLLVWHKSVNAPKRPGSPNWWAHQTGQIGSPTGQIGRDTARRVPWRERGTRQSPKSRGGRARTAAAPGCLHPPTIVSHAPHRSRPPPLRPPACDPPGCLHPPSRGHAVS